MTPESHAAAATLGRDAHAGHGHATPHGAAVAHQFDDIQQQRSAAELGMWLFLATEVMFFGGMITAYVVYRFAYPEAFAAASQTLDTPLGAINTCVLLTSSLTMALAVHACRAGNRTRLIQFLLVTIVLGAAFLGVKGYEYHHKYVTGLVPLFGWPFEYSGPDPARAALFFQLYFVMTGVHAAHMVAGIVALAVLVVLARRGAVNAVRYTPVDLTGLYWHFVDLVWIYLFPFLYLIDPLSGGPGH